MNKRIVITGGPGGGKTTAADLFRREVGESIVVVPEAATMLFSGGFPRHPSTEARIATQSSIYQVQRSLEEVMCAEYPDRVLLCDRGTLDGSVYWPDGPDSFLEFQKTTLEEELDRYEAVLFFETAAVGHISIEGGNPIRNESLQEAVDLDLQLREIWSNHPEFYFIPHQQSFMRKVTSSVECLGMILDRVMNNE